MIETWPFILRIGQTNTISKPRNTLHHRFPNCGPRTPRGPWGTDSGSAGNYCFLVEFIKKIVNFCIQSLLKICSKTHYCSYFSTPAVKQINEIIIYYAVILTIGSEENSVAFYLTSETDSYYFSLAIFNSITKECPNNYASAISHNVIKCCDEWQKHNYYYYYKYYSCEAGLSYYSLHFCNENKM